MHPADKDETARRREGRGRQPSRMPRGSAGRAAREENGGGFARRLLRSGTCNSQNPPPAAHSGREVSDQSTASGGPRVLEAVANPEISRRIEPLLRRAEAQTLKVDHGGAFALAALRPFDLVIAQCPLAGMSAGRILECLRPRQAGTPKPPVILLTREAYLPTIDSVPADDRAGVRVTATMSEGLRAIAQALEIGDRSSVKLMVQIEMIVESTRFQRLCQTHDVSPTGMLLSTRKTLPIGAVLPFSLELPEDEEPIHGSGEIVRHARPEKEPAPAMGVRFLGLHGDGPKRLESFLSSRRSRPRSP